MDAEGIGYLIGSFIAVFLIGGIGYLLIRGGKRMLKKINNRKASEKILNRITEIEEAERIE